MARAQQRLDRDFFARKADALAIDLLGRILVRVTDEGERLAGRIVETEAYLGPEDKAAHSAGWRRTPRTEPMFGPPGLSYVFLTYGMHHCFNIVCDREGSPQAVLIRALQPLEGLETMRCARLSHRGDPLRPMPDNSLCSGPARLCQALAIDRGLNGVDLTGCERIWLERGDEPSPERKKIGNSARIGVAYAQEWADARLRWFEVGSGHVSRGPVGTSGRRGAADGRGISSPAGPGGRTRTTERAGARPGGRTR
ncbi:MAG: DNA-3-methyladenine glycosylase [Phycisphaerales bacterium]|nr:DNA-3-methyladenine glycosylase [Phycisphaerales bacterium]